MYLFLILRRKYLINKSDYSFDDEDKALRLIWSLPSSYEYMKPILVYGKETVVFSEVTSNLLSEERRLSGGGNNSSEGSALTVENGKRRTPIKRI